jgi:hypothetical protein
MLLVVSQSLVALPLIYYIIKSSDLKVCYLLSPRVSYLL